jgi:hypothetical protein
VSAVAKGAYRSGYVRAGPPAARRIRFSSPPRERGRRDESDAGPGRARRGVVDFGPHMIVILSPVGTRPRAGNDAGSRARRFGLGDAHLATLEMPAGIPSDGPPRLATHPRCHLAGRLRPTGPAPLTGPERLTAPSAYLLVAAVGCGERGPARTGLRAPPVNPATTRDDPRSEGHGPRLAGPPGPRSGSRDLRAPPTPAKLNHPLAPEVPRHAGTKKPGHSGNRTR